MAAPTVYCPKTNIYTNIILVKSKGTHWATASFQCQSCVFVLGHQWPGHLLYAMFMSCYMHDTGHNDTPHRLPMSTHCTGEP